MTIEDGTHLIIFSFPWCFSSFWVNSWVISSIPIQSTTENSGRVCLFFFCTQACHMALKVHKLLHPISLHVFGAQQTDLRVLSCHNQNRQYQIVFLITNSVLMIISQNHFLSKICQKKSPICLDPISPYYYEFSLDNKGIVNQQVFKMQP